MTYEEKVAMIYMAITSCFKEDNEIGIYMPLSDINVEFFEAGVAALQLLHQRITEEDLDIVEFVGFLNKAVVQGLLERNVTVTDSSED